MAAPRKPIQFRGFPDSDRFEIEPDLLQPAVKITDRLERPQSMLFDREFISVGRIGAVDWLIF